MQIEEQKTVYLARFLDSGILKFLKCEMARFVESIPREQQPRRSSSKEPSPGALKLREFI